jgi:SAM-dependent methyltransferase
LENIAARWNAKAEHWDRELRDPQCHLNEDEAYDYFLDQLIGVVRERPAFCAAHGIIDAGCATGLVLAKAISGFAWGIGVDISPRMIETAQAKQIPRATFVIGDCFSLCGICPAAGAVVSRGILLSHYGPARGAELLKSARSVLVEGGFILCDFLNLAGRTRSRHAPDNKAYFDSEEICTMAIKAGCHNVRTLGEPTRRVGLLLAEIS